MMYGNAVVVEGSRGEDVFFTWLETQTVLMYNLRNRTLTPEPPCERKFFRSFMEWAERNKYVVPMCADNQMGVVVYQVTVDEDVTDLLAADVVYYCHHVPGYNQALRWLASIGDADEVSASECPLMWHEPWPGMKPWQDERAQRAFVQELAELGLLTRLSVRREASRVRVRFRVNREACELALATVSCDHPNIERFTVTLGAFADGSLVPFHRGGVVVLEAEVRRIEQPRPRGRPRKNPL